MGVRWRIGAAIVVLSIAIGLVVLYWAGQQGLIHTDGVPNY